METPAPALDGARPGSPARTPLFFVSPTPEEAPPAPRTSPEATPPAAGEGSPDPLEDGAASSLEWESDDLEESSDDAPTSSRASSRSGNPVKVASQATLRASTRQAVIIGAGMAHRFGARSEGQKRVGLYLADEEDADAIADPLSSILHRRGGLVGKEMSQDAVEGVQVLMALGGYVSKQIVKTTQAREVDEYLAAGGTLDV